MDFAVIYFRIVHSETKSPKFKMWRIIGTSMVVDSN